MNKPERGVFFKLFLGNLGAGAIPIIILLFLYHLARPIFTRYYLLPLTLALASSVILSLILTLVYTRRLNKMLRELKEVITKIPSEHNPPSSIPRWSGLNEIIKAITTVASQLRQTEAELQEKEDLLKIILNTIPDGVIVTNATGRVVLTNPSIAQLTGTEHIVGKFYWEVFRKAELTNLLQQLTPDKTPLTTEIQFNGQTFLTTAVLKDKTRIIIFKDITAIVRAEKIKQDFVLNVSHELRTPLAAIKGYTETLEETADEENLGYLKIIKRHTDRLINLIQDLLQLARIEDKQFQIQKEDIDIKMLIGNVVTIFTAQARKRGIDITTSVPDTIKTIEADPLLLEQALINLLDNALKYTEKGTVAITAANLDDYVAISVKDTGIGIEKEHLDRIFERFYVVNRSRSRQTGGTGLGLAIVKHIVELHRGKISVESSPGSGSKFTIILPVKL